jgi:hypothetical protein
MSNENSSPAARFLAQEFPVQSPLIARLKSFMPTISAANEQLEKQEKLEDCGISIEPVAKEESDSGSESDEEVNSFLNDTKLTLCFSVRRRRAPDS